MDCPTETYGALQSPVYCIPGKGCEEHELSIKLTFINYNCRLSTLKLEADVAILGICENTENSDDLDNQTKCDLLCVASATVTFITSYLLFRVMFGNTDQHVAYANCTSQTAWASLTIEMLGEERSLIGPAHINGFFFPSV